MSKTYTAAAVLLLAQRGQLSLKDSVRKYLPAAPESWQDITLGQLVSHSSGLIDDWGLDNDWENTATSLFGTARNNAEFLQRLYETPLQFPPGTSVSYACGTFILGVVIEEVTGQRYAHFMQQQLFEPLGLKRTWVADHDFQIPDRVSGYVFENDVLQAGYPLSKVALARGDVSIRTSARDIALWLSGLRKGALLSQASKELMHRYATLNDGSAIPYSYGGWFVYPLRGKLIVDHGGNYRTGFSSYMAEYPEDDLTIIVLTNLADISWYQIIQKVASFYNPDYRLIRDIPRMEEPSNAPTKTIEQVITALSAGKHDQDVMAESFPSAFYGERLRKQIGSLNDLAYVAHRDVSNEDMKVFGTPVKTIWFYSAKADKSLYLAVHQGKNGKIVFLEYPES